MGLAQTVDYDVVSVGGVKSMIFGGEGVFFARLRGPGHVWLQSLPFSRLAGRIMANLTDGREGDLDDKLMDLIVRMAPAL